MAPEMSLHLITWSALLYSEFGPRNVPSELCLARISRMPMLGLMLPAVSKAWIS
jgi:hypothetical protein